MLKKRIDFFSVKFSFSVFIIAALLVCFAINKSIASDNPAKHLSKANQVVEHNSSLDLWSFKKGDLHPDPDLVFKKLSNGFAYILLKNQHPKDRVSMHLYIQAGSMHESDSQQGLAHFLEHMLFNGSTHFKPAELVKFFQSIGMQFGADANAHTGFNETVYDILLPEGNKENLVKGLVVMKDFAEGALLLPSEIERERRVVLSEKRTRDSASYRTYIKKLKFEFPDAIISKRLPIGREEILKKADQEQFKAFYDTWYRPDNMILVLVGDFESELAGMLIEDKFSTIIPRAPPGKIPDLGDIAHKGIKPFYHFEKESGNTTVSIEILEKILSMPDSYDFRQKELIENIANRMVKYRLDTLIQKPGTPFTSASISSGIFLRQVKYADITADCNPENWEKSLSLIEQTLRQALIFGFTTSELARVKKDLLSELDDAVKKASTRDSKKLAREIIWGLNSNRVFMSPQQEKELYTPIINSVTLKNVHDAFKDIWAPEHRLLVVSGNAKLTDKNPETKILNTYHKGMQTAVSRPAEGKSVVFPYLLEPKKEGRITQTKKMPDLEIIQVDFRNGVRLNLKKTDFQANQILINLSFGQGKSCEPLNKPGLALLTENVIDESGLGTLTKDELKWAMAGKNTHVTFSIDEDRFLLQGETVSNEVSLLFQLLYAHIMDPGFRKDAYELSLKRFRQKYIELSRSINGAMALSGSRFLAGGDPRFGLPDDKTFNKLTLDDIKSWISPFIGNNDIEVSVVGDVDIDSIIQLTARYFGSLTLHPTVNTQKELKLPVFPVGQSQTLSVQTKISKGLIILAYPTEDIWNINRTRRLSILSDIISDRFREQIREKLGSAYSTFAFNRPSKAYPGYGVLQAMAYIDPNESDIVIKEIKKIVSNLAKDGVTQDELSRAKEPTLTSIKDMFRKNNYWLDTVLTGSKIYPQKIDWSRTILKDYASITKEGVSNIAKKYLVNDKAATIIIKPK
ncbi:MAG: insulinase family protein [Desulfobacteraceae bacterium]|nr:insulinase family protein [Desulfobacteraceae bacterium]MDH3571995.1 insulinase family protein [Desulfobacteraceae bacterium]MDH3720479.1 insulinase family protein [Desulfobacteraceae bacterium]MDH3835630.1 insulinase family protein [Desulfobacteraceae bacterium]MDH3872961.1 insulinase family protein [Desulfobacteraceae bacterium]